MESSQLAVMQSCFAPCIPQLQAGLAALRQGLETVEDALQALSGAKPQCPLCGGAIETRARVQSYKLSRFIALPACRGGKQWLR